MPGPATGPEPVAELVQQLKLRLHFLENAAGSPATSAVGKQPREGGERKREEEGSERERPYQLRSYFTRGGRL